MSSPRFSLHWKDLESAVRHTVYPVIAGGAVAVLDTVQSGQFSYQTAKTAAVTAVVAGVIRLLKQWVGDNTQS